MISAPLIVRSQRYSRTIDYHPTISYILDTNSKSPGAVPSAELPTELCPARSLAQINKLNICSLQLQDASSYLRCAKLLSPVQGFSMERRSVAGRKNQMVFIVEETHMKTKGLQALLSQPKGKPGFATCIFRSKQSLTLTSCS